MTCKRECDSECLTGLLKTDGTLMVPQHLSSPDATQIPDYCKGHRRNEGETGGLGDGEALSVPTKDMN